MKIIGLLPLKGNGGIASWSKKFISTFPSEEYNLSVIDVSSEIGQIRRNKKILRIITGAISIIKLLFKLNKITSKNSFDVLHITTSGNIGTIRDYLIARFCCRKGIKSILHCHYGCIPEVYYSQNLIGNLLRKTFAQFDQIWVLDNRTLNFLGKIDNLSKKVKITPNSIEVEEIPNIESKTYHNVAFVGNLEPTKGLFELVEAVTQTPDYILTIVGPGNENVINKIKEISKGLLGNRIKLIGRVPNEEAVNIIKSMDIIALPTYYQAEAFPISILEAMSYGKLVISTDRAAIKDMLTDIDGNLCGIIVREKNILDIVNALIWCQKHKKEADKLCQKAYEKVYSCYRTEIVYNRYRQLYNEAISQTKEKQ